MAATYVVWGVGTAVLWDFSAGLAVVVTAIAIAQFSSLQHEVLHGHPFASTTLNEALVFPGLTLFVPYGRFRDLHLAHHHDPSLTDPYEDPESNFLDPAVWARTSRLMRIIHNANNVLVGRVTIGPALGLYLFLTEEVARLRKGDRAVARAWIAQGFGVALVFGWLLTVGSMPVWAYLIAAYAGFSLLKIRTFLEHRAHEAARARTVIIEDRGPLSLLFLNNNLHVVHHMHPDVPWYDLPAKYAANREHYQRRNDGYVFRSYAEVFRLYFLRAKDPVPHPIWPIKPAPDQTILRNAGIAPELSKNGTPG